MPPKAVKSRNSAAEPNYAKETLNAFTSQENRSIVTAIGLFALGVTFLHSSWAEAFLLPPM